MWFLLTYCKQWSICFQFMLHTLRLRQLSKYLWSFETDCTMHQAHGSVEQYYLMNQDRIMQCSHVLSRCTDKFRWLTWLFGLRCTAQALGAAQLRPAAQPISWPWGHDRSSLPSSFNERELFRVKCVVKRPVRLDLSAESAAIQQCFSLTTNQRTVLSAQ
jgi:hypothetical protein